MRSPLAAYPPLSAAWRLTLDPHSSSARPPQLDQLAARLARAHARAAALPRPSSDVRPRPHHLAHAAQADQLHAKQNPAAISADGPAAPAPLAALLDALGPAKPVTPPDALPWPPSASTSTDSSSPTRPLSPGSDTDAPPPLGAPTAAGKSERSALAALTPPAPASAAPTLSTSAAPPADLPPAFAPAPPGSRLRARRTAPAPSSSSRPTSTASAATSADEADAPTPSVSSSAPPSPARRTPAPAAPGPADDKPVPAYLAAKRARAREKALRAAAEEEARLAGERAAEEREKEEREERERREREEKSEGRGRLGLRLRGRGGKEKEKGKGKEGAVSARDELLPVGSSAPGKGADLASYHASEQASLLGALSSLSSTLKASTLEFSTLLERDKEVLQAAEGKLEGSEGAMSKEGKRLEGVRKKGRGTTCATLGILAVVAVLWVLVFLLIKVT